MAIQVAIFKENEGSIESMTRTACNYSCIRFKDALFVGYGISTYQAQVNAVS